MAHVYDLVFAEFLQVWLHRAHLANARAVDGEARVLDFFDQLLAETGQRAGTHPGAPALLANLRALAQQVAAGAHLTPSALKQALTGALYAALRQSTVPAAPRAIASGRAPREGAAYRAIGIR